MGPVANAQGGMGGPPPSSGAAPASKSQAGGDETTAMTMRSFEQMTLGGPQQPQRPQAAPAGGMANPMSGAYDQAASRPCPRLV